MPPAAPTHMELISSDLYHVSGPCCVYSVNLMYILRNGKQHQLLQLMSRVVTSGSPGHMWDSAAVMSSLQQKLPGTHSDQADQTYFLVYRFHANIEQIFKNSEKENIGRRRRQFYHSATEAEEAAVRGTALDTRCPLPFRPDNQRLKVFPAGLTPYFPFV